jgi:uncharacterized protein (DUF427 family)
MAQPRRLVLEPTAEHPITTAPANGEIVVTVGDREVARTSRGITLSEATYPPVFYVPLEDVDASVLRPSATTTYCPYKGEASHYSVDPGDGTLHEDVAWTYPDPYPAVAEIAGRLAFYPHRARVRGPVA